MLKKISDISTSISNMAAEKWATDEKKLKNPMLRGYFDSKAHKNKIPTAVPMFLGMMFSMAIIFTSPGVAITPEINMTKSGSSFSSANVACSHHSDVRL